MATNIKLLDENALSAIKTYVDTQVGQAGKVDDVKIGTTSVVSNKVATIVVDGAYNSSSNKVATQTTVSNAIGALDVSNISGFGAGKTLASLTETDGKIAATFQDIQLASTEKVTGLDTALSGKVPTSRTIAGLALSSDITSSSLIAALGLQQAMTYIGIATTTKPSEGQYVQTVIGSTTYYVSITSSGAATQVNAVKGQILTIDTKEYICTTAGASGTNVFSEMGDESSYALKTITVTGTGALSGGGNLTTNRTITHNAGNAASKTSGFYKFSTDAYSHISSVTAVAKSDLTGLGVADDSAVVHKTGDESISGIKTFSSDVTLDGNTTISGTATFNGDIALAGTIKSKSSADASYGIEAPDTSSWTANRTMATTADIPSVSNYVKGPSSATSENIALFDGTTGKLIKDGGTALSTVTNHISNTTVHITSAERTSWNNKISAVKSLKTDAAASQSTSASEALSGSGTIILHKISKTGKLSDLLSADGGAVSVITAAEINAILYPSA